MPRERVRDKHLVESTLSPDCTSDAIVDEFTFGSSGESRTGLATVFRIQNRVSIEAGGSGLMFFEHRPMIPRLLLRLIDFRGRIGRSEITG